MADQMVAEAPPREAVAWRERRTRPMLALYGVPTVFLAAMTFGIQQQLALQILCGAGAVVLAVLGYRAWPKAVIETYSVSEQAVTVERPGEPAVSVPLSSVRQVTVRGDKVEFDTDHGQLTMGFVRKQRRLLQTLERVAPEVVINTKLDAVCRT